jgi:hypothetical protein
VRLNRGLIVPVVLVAVVVAAALGAGKSKQTRAAGPVTVLFGTQFEQTPSAPGLDFINGWVVADDIAVYAGDQSSDSSNGLLVIVRTSSGKQRSRNIVLHGSGPVTLVRPSVPSTDSVAAAETLRFVTANGSLGRLDLSDDKVSLSAE